MKHGRSAIPFKKRRRGGESYYVGACENCGKEYKVGAPRWLPDDVVVRKLQEAGLTGQSGHLDKGVPRHLYCTDCAPGSGGAMPKNVLFDALPQESSLRLRTVQPNVSTGTYAIRVALPHEVGDVIRLHNLPLVARFIRTGGGAVSMKIKPAAEGEGRRGGHRNVLENGDATRWYAVRIPEKATSSTRPTVNVSVSLMEQLLDGANVKYLDSNIYVPVMCGSRRGDKVRGQPAFRYDAPNLGEYIAEPVEDTHPDQAAADEQEQEQSETTQSIRIPGAGGPVPAVVPQESIPTGVQEFSMEGSLQELRRVLEAANLHIMNLRDKGWVPEIVVGEDGHLSVKISVTLS